MKPSRDLRSVDSSHWKEYLFEFLLLFLAITAGFFVDNQRELFKERREEKEFIEALHEDLITDTARINEVVTATKLEVQHLDSFLNKLTLLKSTDVTPDLYEWHYECFNGLEIFRNSVGTIDQLTNSGGLNLIRNADVTKAITKYDVETERLRTWNERSLIAMNDALSACDKVFDYSRSAAGDPYAFHASQPFSLKMNAPDAGDLRLVYNKLWKMRTHLEQYNVELLGWKRQLTQMIVLLREDYRLE